MSKNKEKNHSHEDADNARTTTDNSDRPSSDSAKEEAPEAKAGKHSAHHRPASHDVGAGDSREGAGDPAAGAADAAKLAQLQDRLLRLQADFDNFRKRTLREKNDLFDSANQALMLELLPMLDHLQLGIQAASEHQADPAFREGLNMILGQLMGALSKFGLSPMETEKQVFDPNRFESVNAVPSATEPEGTVVASVRHGYMLRNKLLRPAQVIVSSGPPPKPSVE